MQLVPTRKRQYSKLNNTKTKKMNRQLTAIIIILKERNTSECHHGEEESIITMVNMKQILTSIIAVNSIILIHLKRINIITKGLTLTTPERNIRRKITMFKCNLVYNSQSKGILSSITTMNKKHLSGCSNRDNY